MPIRMLRSDPQKKPIHILCLFDYVAHTGYATVSKNIVPLLKKILGSHWHFDICAINYFGDLYEEPDGTTVFSAIKSLPPETQLMLSQMQSGNDSAEFKQRKLDDFGRIGFAQVLQNSAIPRQDDLPGETGYDGIFIINDLGVICPLHVMFNKIKEDMKAKNYKNFKSLFYFPVDCPMIPEIIDGIEFFDGLVTYTEFGRQEILKIKPKLKGKLKVIPHGCNMENFYPLWKRGITGTINTNERTEFRRQYFGEENADKFIVLNLNRNQHRKDIPATIFGFMEYKKRNPDSLLLLHMHGRDPMGWDIRSLMWQTGLKENIDFILPPQEVQDSGAPVDQLNRIYNACDVYLTTTRGEGWGLGVTEAMACRLPVICPLNSSFSEITDNGNRAWLLENQYPIADRADNIIRGQVDPDEVADQLETVFRDRESLSTMYYYKKINAASKYVETLHWEGIAQRWAEVFKEVY